MKSDLRFLIYDFDLVESSILGKSKTNFVNRTSGFLVFPQIPGEISMLPFVATLPYARLIFSIHQPHCRALQLQQNDFSESFIKIVTGHQNSQNRKSNFLLT
jgi:hypothetical protein